MSALPLSMAPKAKSVAASAARKGAKRASGRDSKGARRGVQRRDKRVSAKAAESLVNEANTNVTRMEFYEELVKELNSLVREFQDKLKEAIQKNDIQTQEIIMLKEELSQMAAMKNGMSREIERTRETLGGLLVDKGVMQRKLKETLEENQELLQRVELYKEYLDKANTWGDLQWAKNVEMRLKASVMLSEEDWKTLTAEEGPTPAPAKTEADSDSVAECGDDDGDDDLMKKDKDSENVADCPILANNDEA